MTFWVLAYKVASADGQVALPFALLLLVSNLSWLKPCRRFKPDQFFFWRASRSKVFIFKKYLLVVTEEFPIVMAM